MEIIKVIGVGGAGGNAINDMVYAGVDGVEYIAANTDKQDLDKSLADVKLQIGEKLTKGQGAGADPIIGEKSAEEDIEKIRALLEGADMVFITAGMGGGTGTGATPVIARVAKEMDILTVAIVTRPFTFEGKKRANNSNAGIEKLKDCVDSLVIIPNDKLFQLPDKNITVHNAFKEANHILKIGIKGVAHLILKNGFINLDFADIKTTMKDSGIAVLGFGEAEGENRAMKSVEQTLQSPLLENSVKGATKLLINICASIELELVEAQKIADSIGEATGEDNTDVIFGITTDPELGEKIQVTLIAAHFTDKMEKNEPYMRVETKKKEEAKPEVKTQEVDNKSLDLPPWLRNNN